MSFESNFETIKNAINETCDVRLNIEKYDSFIVKKIAETNRLQTQAEKDKDNENRRSGKGIFRTTGQTHIAITGKQMDIFPVVAPSSIEELRKFFIFKIPIDLSSNNVEYLKNNFSKQDYIADLKINFNEKAILTENTCIHTGHSNTQVQLSLLMDGERGDSENFLSFRRLIELEDFIIILKLKNKVHYKIYGIKKTDAESYGLNKLDGTLNYIENRSVNRNQDVSFLNHENVHYLNSNLQEDELKYGKTGKNILFYGVAGVGKSYNIDQITNKDETHIERIVFHPDYLNTDFIGQILPQVKKDKDDKNIIEYEFKAGSFTKILKKAFENPKEHYYLVIEEINRGNAPAIFGEIFQLLDRNSDGRSTYSISNDLIIDDINKSHKIQSGQVQKLTSIYIPSNLTILATMNTADQNVFTLDTAFQRRWTMRMIENNIDNCDYRNDPILDTGITWQNFNTVINDHILTANQNTLSSEDKRLGAFFIRKDELTFPTEVAEGIPFAEKVIKYLWDDVFKFNKSALFESRFNSLDKVLNEFKNNPKDKRFEIFIYDVRSKLTPISQLQVESQVQPTLADNGFDDD